MSPILFDTIIGIIIILSTVIAFFRGFVREVLTIVNLLAATAAAYYLGDDLIPTMQSWLGADASKDAEEILGFIPPDVLGVFLAYAAVFFGTFIILILAGMAISSTIDAMGLGALDKTLGMLFGAFRGYLLIFLLYIPFAAIMPPSKFEYPAFFKESLTFLALDKSYAWVDDYTGEEEGADGKKKPGIITQHLKNMGDDFARKSEKVKEDTADALENAQENMQENRRELPREILSDEELQAP
jgi:membrane protein required for colicin V production